MLRNVGAFAVDLIYPKRCAGCGQRGHWLCPGCDRELARFEPPWCFRCGVPVALERCQCEDISHAISWVRSIGPFEGWLRGAVIQIKYHGEWGRCANLGPPLSLLLGGVLPDGLVPVPLHPARLKQRGFNQSRVFAEQTALQMGCEVSDMLRRIRKTPSQVSLGAGERRENVKGAIAIARNADVAGKDLVLVDDVITTSSTLSACAEALLLAGARSIGAITVAREL